MATKEDKSRVTLEVDGKQAINQLGKLEMEAKQLAIDLKDMKRGTKEYIATSKELKSVKSNIEAVRKEIGLTGMTMTQLVRHQRDLRKEMGNTATYGTAKYKELQTQYQAVTAEITKQRKELAGTAGFFSDIKKELKAFAVMAVGALGVTQIFSQFQNLITGSAKLSDAYADVQKTTELTKAEMNELMKEFKGFNTRTPRAELLALADEAGKMGKRGVKEIALYVQETNELTTALSDLGEDAGLKVAKMADRFNVSMRQIGSGINAVADNTKAKAGFITEFLSRLAGTGNEVGIAAGDILGYGAAIDEMGLNVEMSSTALNMFLIDFTKSTEKFGDAAGFAKGELSKLIGEKGTNEGFLLFLERLREANPQAAQFLRKLEEIGIDGARGSQVFLALSQNVGQLRDRQALANREIEKGTSLTEEYNKKNENFAGNLEKIQKWMASMFVNTSMMDGLNAFVSLWAKWIKIPISSKMEDERLELQKLYIKITDANLATGDRIKLIEQLKKDYPKHLENINAETVTNGQLAKSIRAINDELINEIILRKQDEKIKEQNDASAGKRLMVMEKEDALIKEMNKVAEEFNKNIIQAGSIDDKARILLGQIGTQAKNQETRDGRMIGPTVKLIELLADYRTNVEQLNNVEGKGNALLEEREKLITKLGIKMEEIQSTTPEVVNPTTVDPTTPIDPKDAEKAKKDLEKRLEQYESYLQKILQLKRDYEIAGEGAHEAELLKVEYQYEALEKDLKTHLENKTITQSEYDAQLRVLQEMELAEHLRINKKYADKDVEERVAAEKKIIEATMEEKELAVLNTNEHYDQLIALAQQFGLETVGIEEARRAAMAKLQETWDKKELEEAAKIAEAKQMIAAGMSASIGAVIDFIGNKQGELTAFQKVLTVAQIAIDSAAALGKIVPLAADAAKGTGPAAPFVFAGYVAAMAGTVLGAIAKAKNALSSANTPEWESSGDEKPNTGRSRPPAPKSKKSFFYGGWTGEDGLEEGDKYGKFAGWVHQKEYVMPQAVMQEPFIANLMPAIEAIRQDRVNGFSGGSQAGSSMTATLDPKSAALIQETLAEVKRMKKDMKAYIVLTELDEAQDERSYLEKRYRA